MTPRLAHANAAVVLSAVKVRGQQQHWHGQDEVSLFLVTCCAIIQVLTFTAERTTAALAWARRGVTLSGDLLCYNTGTHLYS